MSDPERTGPHALPVERYEWAATKVADLLVADAACGLGYGAAILDKQASCAIGFDASAEAIVPTIPFVHCNVEAQTFRGFDAVVCLEALSHFIDPLSWMKGLDVPVVVLSMPIVPSMAVYPWRKHEFTVEQFENMIEPKWTIRDRLQQKRYLTIYAEAP